MESNKDINIGVQVMRLRADLQREHERKLVEVREASRRMQEDCDHQVALERSVSWHFAVQSQTQSSDNQNDNATFCDILSSFLLESHLEMV